MAAKQIVIIDLTRDDDAPSPSLVNEEVHPHDAIHHLCDFYCDVLPCWCMECRRVHSEVPEVHWPGWMRRKVREQGRPPAFDVNDKRPFVLSNGELCDSYGRPLPAVARELFPAAGAPVIVPAPAAAAAAAAAAPVGPPGLRAAVRIRAGPPSRAAMMRRAAHGLVGQPIKYPPRKRKTADSEVVAQARRRSARVPSHVSSIAVVPKGGHRFPLKR